MAQSLDYWVVRLRGHAIGGIAELLPRFIAFNTYKFMTRPAALAWCREQNVNPIDFLLVKVRAREPKVLEVTEINYSTSEVALASGE